VDFRQFCASARLQSSGRKTGAGHADHVFTLSATGGSSVVVKVLYIEDNDDDVYMLKMRLELLGNFEVLTAEDGEKGCEVAAAEQPDIILMDLEMPVVDGWAAARRLKRNSQTQDIPIIALSAHALAGEREKAIATGCEEFDTKPIEFDRLVATVRRVLDGRK
jgi:CheY-like chemotaxis protein